MESKAMVTTMGCHSQVYQLNSYNLYHGAIVLHCQNAIRGGVEILPVVSSLDKLWSYVPLPLMCNFTQYHEKHCM